MEGEAVRIWHPLGVYFVVFAWRDAVNFVSTRPDVDVTSSAAVDIDRWCWFKEPDTHLETEILGGEGANWTEVNGVHAVV